MRAESLDVGELLRRRGLPLRLLVLAPAHLARLMAAAPSVDAAVRRAAHERLDRVAADT